MTAELQLKEDSMGALVKVPSNQSIREEESDEYYSNSDSMEETRSETSWSDLSSPREENLPSPKFSLAVEFLRRLHGTVVMKKGPVFDDLEWQDSFLNHNDSTFPNDPTGELPNSWGAADSSSFRIRGETYLQNRKKITGKGTTMQLVAANMLRSISKQDDLGGRHGSICQIIAVSVLKSSLAIFVRGSCKVFGPSKITILGPKLQNKLYLGTKNVRYITIACKWEVYKIVVQKFAAADHPDFFFIVNMQIPGPTTILHLAFYYATTSPIKDVPLLKNFVEGDDEYRNSRFKLIPRVSKGPWLVKQSVGNRPCLLGQVLKIHYVRGVNYLELDVDVGSSVIAKKVANRVVSTFNHLIVEAAFVIQGNTPEELPEHVLGTCRMSHIDISKVACTQ